MEVVGLVMWAVLLYPLWSLRCRRIRRTHNRKVRMS